MVRLACRAVVMPNVVIFTLCPGATGVRRSGAGGAPRCYALKGAQRLRRVPRCLRQFINAARILCALRQQARTCRVHSWNAAAWKSTPRTARERERRRDERARIPGTDIEEEVARCTT
jgi:hypothetical protein